MLNHEIQNMSSADDLLSPGVLTALWQDLLGEILLSTYCITGIIQVLRLQQQFSGVHLVLLSDSQANERICPSSKMGHSGLL